MVEDTSKVIIDGKEYLLSDLSDAIKGQLQRLKFVDGEISQLKARLTITNTARSAYANELKALLKDQPQ